STSFLREHLVDRLIAVIAPKIVGAGINAVGDLGIRRMENSLRLSFERITRSGDDLIIETRFNSTSQPGGLPP
ncbi:MAG: dihydrofolate reductase family protein, partial [Proteobacteria bacterium]|nr:dihydrofolate reductase family protein [Pseudomonadota bacterium]